MMLLHIFGGNTLSFLSSSFLFLVAWSGQGKRLFPYLKPKGKAHIPNISLVQDEGQDMTTDDNLILALLLPGVGLPWTFAQSWICLSLEMLQRSFVKHSQEICWWGKWMMMQLGLKFAEQWSSVKLWLWEASGEWLSWEGNSFTQAIGYKTLHYYF